MRDGLRVGGFSHTHLRFLLARLLMMLLCSQEHQLTMAITAPPPPFDDPTLSDPLECPPLRWGLIGCGRVSHDFAQALKHIPSASVVACSARDIDRAQEFATKHKIPRAYGSYDEMLKDKDVECVVSNFHST